MSQYKELADRLQEPGPGTAAFYEACDKAAAILRSLDAQPVAVYHGRCVESGHSDVEMLKMIPAGTKLYAAPVAAQPQQASKPLSVDWLWAELMDWCKLKGYSPASQRDLFAIVSKARAIEAAHGIKEQV